MKYSCIILLLCLLAIVSCELEIETPDLQITTETNTYRVGESIKFKVQGNADMVAFYSGEPSNQYEYKEGRIIDVSGQGALMEFTSGVTGGTQEEQLTILASSDFDGTYDLEGVNKANWLDITDRFTLGTSATFSPSSLQDISDLFSADEPLFIAFKYVTKPQEEHGLARNWMIQNFQIKSPVTFNENPLTVVDQINAAFQIVDSEPENAPSRSTITSTRVSLLGNVYKDPNDPIYDPENPIFDPENPIYDPESHLYDPNAVRPDFVPYDPSSPYNDPPTENWAISRPIYIDKVDLGPDWSTVIKGISISKLEEYTYAYHRPGTYTAYFVAINASIDGTKEVIHQFELNIEP